MALPLVAVAGRAVAGGAGRALGNAVRLKGVQLDKGVDFKPFHKALANLKKQLSPVLVWSKGSGQNANQLPDKQP